ncbi:MAG: helix-turn-helix domain-containing protein [FCB group bacterium]|jgi:excisionase family DNA binding protein
MKKKELVNLITISVRNEIAPVILLLQKGIKDEKILGRKEVMQMLHISSTKMYYLVKSNQIKYCRIGRQLRFKYSDIIEMLNSK